MWWRELQQRGGTLARPKGEVRIDPSAHVAHDAVLDTSQGSITIGPRSRVCSGAHIVGPVRIDEDCLIGNLAMIRGHTSIGQGCRIGFAAEVKNAIIGDRVTIGPQCFVADSRVDEDAYLGAQVRTSNHRLDKRNVEVIVDGIPVDTGLEKLGCHIGARAALGIQVIVLPGRIIAPDSLFGPRITIERNLPTGRYRQAQQLQSF
jgi:bifunctional UDP-N-acetylglucosamine pyrophosphorylase/glucosamine-1-phosphate N-acetyltransferase